MQSNQYTIKEEVLNALTHGIGVGLGIATLVMLTIFSTQQMDPWKVVSSILFGSTIIIMYLSSTLYHALTHSQSKYVFKILDHSSIFLLIAGSYTPFCLVTMRGDWGWPLFCLVWGLAIAGVFFKIYFTGRFEIVSTILYVLIGWIAIIAIDPLFHDLPLYGFFWLVAGGLCYTTGVIFYVWDKPYHHSIWHLFVLAGTICHIFAILFYVVL